MYTWNYNEKMLKDLIYNHAKDAGRFYCEMFLNAPSVYKQFLEGYYDELHRQCGTNRREHAAKPAQDET